MIWFYFLTVGKTNDYEWAWSIKVRDMYCVSISNFMIISFFLFFWQRTINFSLSLLKYVHSHSFLLTEVKEISCQALSLSILKTTFIWNSSSILTAIVSKFCCALDRGKHCNIASASWFLSADNLAHCMLIPGQSSREGNYLGFRLEFQYW